MNWIPIQTGPNQGRFETIDPGIIERHKACQPRVDGTDPKVVADYAMNMRVYDETKEHGLPGWKKFPHIYCIKTEDGKYILYSGFHRHDAMLQVGYDAVEIWIYDGTLQDAILLSKGANANHGVRRTNADKEYVVRSCLLDDELKQWSNEQIAKWCGVAPKTVKNHEDSLCKLQSENGELYTRPTQRKRLSESGDVEWIETARIGKNGKSSSESKPKSGKSELKQAKDDHNNAIVRVQSAFFDADLHRLDTEFDAPETGKKFQKFFCLVVAAQELRSNINSRDFSGIGVSEIRDEIEGLHEIAKHIRFYKDDDGPRVGWLNKVIDMFKSGSESESESEDEHDIWLQDQRDKAQQANIDMWKAFEKSPLSKYLDKDDFMEIAGKQYQCSQNFPDPMSMNRPEIWVARFNAMKLSLENEADWVKAWIKKFSLDAVEDFLEAHYIEHQNWDGLSIDTLSADYGCAPSKIYTIMEKIRKVYAADAEDTPQSDESHDTEKTDRASIIEEWRSARSAVIDLWDGEISQTIRYLDNFKQRILECYPPYIRKEVWDPGVDESLADGIFIAETKQFKKIASDIQSRADWVKEMLFPNTELAQSDKSDASDEKDDAEKAEEPVDWDQRHKEHVARLEALPGEIKAFIPTWIDGDSIPSEWFKGYEDQITLKLLLNARCQIEFNRERGPDPFFKEEMEDLLERMKTSNQLLIDKVSLLLGVNQETCSHQANLETLDAIEAQVKASQEAEKSVEDVLGGKTLEFITVCLRDAEPAALSDKGRLHYLTFEEDSENPLRGSELLFSDIPEPLLVELLEIALRENRDENSD